MLLRVHRFCNKNDEVINLPLLHTRSHNNVGTCLMYFVKACVYPVCLLVSVCVFACFSCSEHLHMLDTNARSSKLFVVWQKSRVQLWVTSITDRNYRITVTIQFESYTWSIFDFCVCFATFTYYIHGWMNVARISNTMVTAWECCITIICAYVEHSNIVHTKRQTNEKHKFLISIACFARERNPQPN